MKPRLPGKWSAMTGLALIVALLAFATLGAGPAASGESAPRGWAVIAIACVDLVLVTALVARGLDVRMVLLLGSIPLFAAKGGLPAMMVKMAAEMANPQTVVPIGSAMGFAFVLRLTACDQHLVQLLVTPIAADPVPADPGRDRRGVPDQHHDREPGRDGVGPRPDLDPPAPLGRARGGPGRSGLAPGLPRWEESCSTPAPSRCGSSPS